MGMYINIPSIFILHIKHTCKSENGTYLSTTRTPWFWMTCSVLVSGSYVSYWLLRPWYLEEFAMSWAAGHRKVKQNSGQSSSTVHTDTFPVQQLKWKYWNFFTFYLSVSVSVSFFACANLYCSILNQILSLNWLMACFKTRL